MTPEGRREHATPHMPLEMLVVTKKLNAWVGGKGSCAVCVDLQAVGALEFSGELYSIASHLSPSACATSHQVRWTLKPSNQGSRYCKDIVWKVMVQLLHTIPPAPVLPALLLIRWLGNPFPPPSLSLSHTTYQCTMRCALPLTGREEVDSQAI